MPNVIEIHNRRHLTNSLKAAKQALKGLSGIYIITCKITGALYIGSSTKLANRLVVHLLVVEVMNIGTENWDWGPILEVRELCFQCC